MAEKVVGLFPICGMVVMLLVVGAIMIKVRRTGNSDYMPKFHMFGKIGWAIIAIAILLGMLAVVNNLNSMP